MLKLKRKGSGSIIMSLISVAFMAAVVLGVTEIHDMNFGFIRAADDKMQAEQYARDIAFAIRSMDVSKIKADNREIRITTGSDRTNTYYYSIEDFDDGVGGNSSDYYKKYKINVYKDEDVYGDAPVVSVVVRHSNPGYLFDGQALFDNASSSNKALRSDYSNAYGESLVNGTLSDMGAADKALSASALHSYVDNMLTEYVKNEEAVKYTGSVGSFMTPVFVGSDDFVSECTMNVWPVESSVANIAVLTPEDGVYYVDYLTREKFFYP